MLFPAQDGFMPPRVGYASQGGLCLPGWVGRWVSLPVCLLVCLSWYIRGVPCLPVCVMVSACPARGHRLLPLTVFNVRPTVKGTPLRKEAFLTLRITRSLRGNLSGTSNNSDTESHFAQGCPELANPPGSDAGPPSRLDEADNGANDAAKSPLPEGRF